MYTVTAKRKILAITLGAMLISTMASTQDIQVDIDPSLKIKYVTADLEKKLGLFPEYPGFIEARLYRIGDNDFSLEILYRMNGDAARKRMSLDNNALKDFRKKISDKLAETNTKTSLDQEGKYALLAGTTIYSLAMHGPLLTNIFTIDETKNIVAVECLMGSGGFFVPFWLTWERQVTMSSAYAYIYGTGAGAFHGLFISMMIYGNDRWSRRTSSSLVTGLSLAEGIGGFYIAEKIGLTAGQVDSAMFGSLWGTVWALETTGIFNDLDTCNRRTLGAALVTGSLGGGALGYYMSTIEDYSRGDAIVQNLAALLGWYVPLAVTEASGTGNNKIFLGASLTGSMAGAVAGYYLIKDKNFSAGQGGLIALGQFAGGLFGVGTAYYFSPGNETLYLTLSSIGAVAGFSVLYYIFHDTLVLSDSGPWNISIMPFALAGFLSRREKNTDRYGDRSDMVPFIAVEYRFN